jgi:hypothetical protein
MCIVTHVSCATRLSAEFIANSLTGMSRVCPGQDHSAPEKQEDLLEAANSCCSSGPHADL